MIQFEELFQTHLGENYRVCRIFFERQLDCWILRVSSLMVKLTAATATFSRHYFWLEVKGKPFGHHFL